MRLRAGTALALAGLLGVLGSAAAEGKLHGRVGMMRLARESRLLSSLGSRGLFDDASVSVSIRFAQAPSSDLLSRVQDLGATFHYLDGAPAHVSNTYTARVPWTALDALASVDEIEWIEPDWHPVPVPPLDVSVPEIGADSCWRSADGSGHQVTGRDVTICDFDTGIDVFHPMFWSDSGASYSWIDANLNGQLDPGIDAVDMNQNGVADPDEQLGYVEASVYDPYFVGGVFNPYGYTANLDWLYNDANCNGQRDYGSPAFAENDPSFGELLFVLSDANGNETVDVGERLHPLDVSKVEATYNTGSIERVYGVDLIRTEPDFNGHGTGVCGIAAGGQVGQRLVGVAPGAKLLVANFYSNIPYTAAQAWGESRGADVMIYEIGWWIGEYLDGTSAVEVNIDTLAARGITQVCPNGNLGGAAKHFFTLVSYPNADSVRCTMDPGYGNQLFVSLLWPGTGSDPELAIREPGGATVTCAANGTFPLGPYTLVCTKSVSPRNTVLADFWIYHASQVSGQFKIYIRQNTPGNTTVDGYIADYYSGWYGGTRFIDYATDEGTVDWPANADSGIGVASYSTRGPFGTPVGQISDFSGRGARIDGYRVTNVAAPGNYDVFSSRSKDESGASFGQYVQFGGTSAAGPHVAGAAALIQQVLPAAGGTGVRELLELHAQTDTYTGSVPNDTWGGGKLRVWPAIRELVTGATDPPAGVPGEATLTSIEPNPCGSIARITYVAPPLCHGSLDVLDLLGRRVSRLHHGSLEQGRHYITWNTHALPPGVYTLRLRAGTHSSTTRAVLVR
jgi:subtilisin family serine protease